jgi:hypothetical protein
MKVSAVTPIAIKRGEIGNKCPKRLPLTHSQTYREIRLEIAMRKTVLGLTKGSK